MSGGWRDTSDEEVEIEQLRHANSRLRERLRDVTVDRDEWRDQHENLVEVRRADLAAIADRNPSGGDVKQAPSRSDESGGADRQSPNLPPQGTE